MSSFAIAIVLTSALIHATWNLFSKTRHPTAAFFLVSSITGILLFSPALIAYRSIIMHCIPTRVWLLLGASGFFLGLYYASLAGAYRAGAISVAYPLARSSPVIVVAVVTMILGRGDQVSGTCTIGIALVVTGCFLIPLHRFSDIRLKNYLNGTCGLALLAALGTSGYSILDDEAIRQLQTNTAVGISNTHVVLVYAGLEALAASIWLAIFVTLRRTGRSNLREVLRTNIGHAILTGAAIHIAYTMVLVSLGFVNNVSYVVGFRQLSIPIGAILGILLLKEAAHPPKLVGVATIFTGLILVAVG